MFHTDVVRVAGRFDRDLLEGDFRAEFANGSFILGTARGGRIRGVVRNFDMKERLVRVEMEGSSWSRSGGLLEFRGESGGKRICNM